MIYVLFLALHEIYSMFTYETSGKLITWLGKVEGTFGNLFDWPSEGERTFPVFSMNFWLQNFTLLVNILHNINLHMHVGFE